MAGEDRRQQGLERFREIVAAYGADPRRWPAAERAALETLLAEDGQAAAASRAAADLDVLLDLVAAPAPSPELMAAVLAAADSPRRRALAEFWPFATIWRPVSALAAAGVLGLVLGAAAPGAIFPEAGDADVAVAVDAYVFTMEAGGEGRL